MIVETLTVTLPAGLYDELKHRAALTQRSIEDELVRTLGEALASSTGVTEIESTVASLAAMDDAALWRLADSRVTSEDSSRLEELADKRQRVGLDAVEMREAQNLVEQHDRVLVIRAEAAALLRQRGHDMGRLVHAE
jgi:plasmid stability protein